MIVFQLGFPNHGFKQIISGMIHIQRTEARQLVEVLTSKTLGMIMMIMVMIVIHMMAMVMQWIKVMKSGRKMEEGEEARSTLTE